MRLPDILQQSALEQAQLVREGAISSEELVGAHLARVHHLNEKLVALVQVRAERALSDARRTDKRRRKNGAHPTTLAGVPSAIKDTDPLRGTFTRIGSRAYRWLWTPFDGLAASRLRQAGLILCGKTSTSELALMPVVEPDTHAPTRNPWQLEHSAGGSSGGAAAAVAAGLLPVAHASDGAGSIRIPAAFCHLFGFKASRGFLPNFYGKFEWMGLATGGVLTHTVLDCAVSLDALRGQVAYPAPAGTLLASLGERPPAGLRVRLCLESELTPVLPEIARGVRAVADLLVRLGHHVEPAPALAAPIEEFMPIYQHLAAQPPVLSEKSLQPVTRWLRQAGRRVSRDEVLKAQNRLAHRVLDWFGDVDLCLMPTVALLAPRVHAWASLPPEQAFAHAAPLGAFTAAFNVSGQPAASLPIGVSEAAGLPYAAQLVARPGRDLTLLQVCRQLEEELRWTARRSPLFNQRD